MPGIATSRHTSTLNTIDAEAKFWLIPVHLANSFGYSRKELNRIQGLIEKHQALLLEKWNEFFRH